MRARKASDREFSRKEMDTLSRWTRSFKMHRRICGGKKWRNRTARVVSGLASVPPCKRQGEHFDWNYLPQYGRLGFLSFFMPLTHTTVLHLWSRSHRLLEIQVANEVTVGSFSDNWSAEKTGLLRQAKEEVFGDMDEKVRDQTRKVESVTVEVGEVLVFVGHLMHAGAEWEEWEGEANTRIHVYFVPAGCPFPSRTDTLRVPPWIRRYMVWQ
jgi:hypothetical protein